MKTQTAKNAIVIWQEAPEDMGVGEPALLIEMYSDVLNITQGDNCISVNYEALKELCSVLKTAKPNI